MNIYKTSALAPALVAALVAALCPSSSLAEPVSVQLTFGAAATGATIKKTGGGDLEVSSSDTGALGVKLSYDLKAPEKGAAGFRYGWETAAAWHKLETSVTDADLGLVTIKNTWSGSIHGRAGYDLGRLYPYALLGFGLSNASLGTNGSAPDAMVSMGSALGMGVEAEFGRGWLGSVEVLAITSPEFTPDGGGGVATTSVGSIRFGLTGRF